MKRIDTLTPLGPTATQGPSSNLPWLVAFRQDHLTKMKSFTGQDSRKIDELINQVDEIDNCYGWDGTNVPPSPSTSERNCVSLFETYPSDAMGLVGVERCTFKAVSTKRSDGCLQSTVSQQMVET